MSMNELMDFRTTFLRSIAEAWANDEFKAALLKDAKKALKDRFGYVWPWGSVCDFKVVDSSKRFEWIGDAWVYSADLSDALILHVPLAPRMAGDQAIPDHKLAMALADYYKQYSSLFSDNWGEPPTPHILVASTSQIHHITEPVIGPSSASPSGGFIPTDEEFAAFNVALLGAMAKAWQDASFKAMLTIDAAAALNAIRGYKLPWNMKIKICDNPSARWHSPAENPSHWSPGHHHLLQLYFPDTPTDFKSQPLALATYNATGAEFPFTCTC